MTLSSLRRVRRLPARLAASGVALIALYAQLGSIFHLAVVRHVECPEHGEMLEVSGDADMLRAVSNGETTTASADARKTHGHDHCLIAAFRRERIRTASLGSVATPALQLARERIAPAPTPPPSPIALLDLAPKSSPPVA